MDAVVEPKQAPVEFQQELLKLRPSLRAFAISLTKKVDTAEDLLQDTMVKALKNFEQFEVDSNLKAWCFTIMRNEFHSNNRKVSVKSEIQDDEHGTIMSRFVDQTDILASLISAETLDMLNDLDEDKREILLEIMNGHSYAEIAKRLDIAEGTAKSRVNRAREALAKLQEHGVRDKRVTNIEVRGEGDLIYRRIVPLQVDGASKIIEELMPTIRWVDPKSLLIETEYQRTIDKKSFRFIRKIVRNFSWSKFKPPICVDINASLVVIDGQHTAIASASHPMIKLIPVYVYKELVLQQRAQSFVSHNTNHLKVHPLALFHAQVAAGDLDSIMLATAVKSSGCYFPKSAPTEKRRKPNQLLNPTVWLQVLKRRDTELIQRMAKIILDSRRGSMSRNIITGLEVLLNNKKYQAITDTEIAMAMNSIKNMPHEVVKLARNENIRLELAFAEMINRYVIDMRARRQ